MDITELDYDLPEHLIAHNPAHERGASQLLVVDASAGVDEARCDGEIGRFDQVFPGQLRDGDLVVANDTRVLHARLAVQRPGGGVGELLLLEPVNAADPLTWRCMARPARRLRPDMPLVCTDGSTIRCVSREADGLWIVELPSHTSTDVAGWLSTVGDVPLPPYITPGNQPADRYQTVYADEHGSVAAPTAGLHFDETLWASIRANHDVAHVTLHVGAGTFQPVRASNLADHDMHAERYTVADTTHAMIMRALDEERRVVAIGTTTTRVLESVYGPSASPRTGQTRLFIMPGYEFGCVGAMLTNFHLPRSTLMALVMARAGTQRIRAAYARAIAEQMRFYSFGDAMFIHGPGITRS